MTGALAIRDGKRDLDAVADQVKRAGDRVEVCHDRLAHWTARALATLDRRHSTKRRREVLSTALARRRRWRTARAEAEDFKEHGPDQVAAMYAALLAAGWD